MIWIITLGWIAFGFIMYRLGWQTGIGEGTSFTLFELRRMRIIHIDPKTEAITPGSAPRQTLKKVIDQVKSD
jgi:hypothetical protein